MSDFLFSTRAREPGALRRQLEGYLAPVVREFAEYHGEWGTLAVARSSHDPEIVWEDDRFLSVLIGEPVARIAPESTGLVGSGPRRRALHGLLRSEHKVDWDKHLDGPFAALVVDKQTGVGMIVTDLMASIPLFSASSESPERTVLALGTHVDAVALAAGKQDEIDPVSAVDLVANLSIVFPHTLYSGVEQVAPGSALRFDPHRGWGSSHSYWQPVERSEYDSVHEAAIALRGAVEEDVRTVCKDVSRVGLLLSAGEDSRAVLGAIPPEVEVRTFIYADWENREVRIARRIARAYGAEFVFGCRDPGHYLRGFELVAAMVGSQHLFYDVHGYGFHEALGIQDLPVVLGGFSADSLLKLDYIPKAGKGAPIKAPDLPGIRDELLHGVAERRTAHRRKVAEIRPESADEWYRLWPFSMRKHTANLHGNRRLFHTHEPFHSNAVVKLAASVPQRWKRNRRLFHLAMRPFLAESWYIPHGKHRFPYFGDSSNLLIGAGIAIVRGVRAGLTGTVRANQGPWPKVKKVVRSELMAQKIRRHPIEDSLLRSLFAPASDEEVKRAIRGWAPLRQLLALQLAFLSSRAGGGLR